jgi:hypothetical protein
LVEVVQTERLSNGVDQLEIRHRRRHDIAKVEAYEVPIPDNLFVLDTRNLHQYEEDKRDEEEERC